MSIISEPSDAAGYESANKAAAHKQLPKVTHDGWQGDHKIP